MHVQWFILWIFLDITFKIIPKIWRPYKLFTISTIDNKENKIIFIGFVLFKFLNENFDFNPKIIHSDYKYALDKAINDATFLKKSLFI